MANKHVHERVQQCQCDVEPKFSSHGLLMCYQREVDEVWHCEAIEPKLSASLSDSHGHDDVNPSKFQ